jgi:protein-disulfide isomerase
MTETKARRFGPFSFFIGALLVAALVGIWTSTDRAAADKTPPAGEDVMAVVGDLEIKVSDLEEANADRFLEIERNRHELLESTLEMVIREKLLELEAAAAGVSVDELTANEIDAKVAEPTEGEVDVFYEARKADLRGQPKEAVAPQIREYLAAQARQKAYMGYVGNLRSKYEVKSYLEPMRFEVAADGFPAKGAEGAPVTIVEFSDFECPYCSRVVPTLDRVAEQYGDQVRLVFRQFPLHQIHPNAQKAAEASLCAFEQDSFWEMHDTMFREQKALSVEQLKEKAARLGLEAEAFNECLDSGRHADQVLADVQEGRSKGVTGTPAMFINGRFLSGAQPFEEIAKVIDDELARLQ